MYSYCCFFWKTTKHLKKKTHIKRWIYAKHFCGPLHQAVYRRCRFRLVLSEIPKRSDWSSSNRGLFAGGKGPCCHIDEQHGRRVRAQTTSGSISKTMKGLVGGFSQASADCRKNGTAAWLPKSSGFGTHPTSTECAQAVRVAWRRQVQGSACNLRGQGRRKQVSLPHVKLAPMSAPGSTGERQEHLDAVISFAGAGQRRRLFRGLDIHSFTWRTRRMPILPQHAVHVLEERSPSRNYLMTTSGFDHWRKHKKLPQTSKKSVIFDRQAVDLHKILSKSDGRILAEMRLKTPHCSQRRRNCSPHDNNAAAGSWVSRRRRSPRHLFPAYLRRLGFRISGNPMARNKVDEKCFWMIEVIAVR